jgi:leucyl/phenylalanyl-tRNA--protein transferase
MFHRATDASKAAVGFLIERLRAGGFSLCDAQVPTPHLARLGAITIPRGDYLARLKRALVLPARLTSA